MKITKGFTLIEVLIVIAIIGILAGIAIPQYGEYVRRGKIQEAVSTLADSRIKLEQFFMDNRTYVNAGGACGVTSPTSRYFAITCAGTATTYTVTATGVAAEGMGGFVYTINQANLRTSTFTASGWNNSTTCWVMKKGDTC